MDQRHYIQPRGDLPPSSEHGYQLPIRTVGPNLIIRSEVVDDWTPVEKTDNESINSDATLSNDSMLRFAVAANSKYSFDASIWFDTVAAADFKWAITLAGVTVNLSRITSYHIAPGEVAITGAQVQVSASNSIVGAGGQGGWLHFEGVLHTGAVGGDFAFQWAQNTSDAGTTTVLAGSRLRYKKAA